MRKLVVVWTLCFVAMLSFSSVRAQSVQLWTQDATQPWLLEALDSFTQETGIEVELRAIGFGTEEVFTAVAAGAPPDLFTHGLAALGAFAATGFLEPFESTLDKWAFAGDIVPQALAAGQYQGRQLALPIGGVVIRDLVYRADFFEEAGFGADQPPQNWTDLVEYARKLTQRTPDGTMSRSGLHVAPSDQWFSMLLRHQGSDLFEHGKSLLSSEAAIEAMTFLHDLIHVHRVRDLSAGGNIVAGTTAMSWQDMQPWSVDETVADSLRAATFPYERQPGTFLGTRIVMMPTDAKNQEGARRLLEYLLRPETQNRLSQMNGSIPFYADANEWDWVQASPVLMHFMSAFSYAYPNPAHELWFDIRTVINEAVTSVINQEQPPANALEQAHARVEALLNQ